MPSLCRDGACTPCRHTDPATYEPSLGRFLSCWRKCLVRMAVLESDPLFFMVLGVLEPFFKGKWCFNGLQTACFVFIVSVWLSVRPFSVQELDPSLSRK